MIIVNLIFILLVSSCYGLDVSVVKPCTVTVSDTFSLEREVKVAVSNTVICVQPGYYPLQNQLYYNVTNLQLQGPTCTQDPRRGQVPATAPDPTTTAVLDGRLTLRSLVRLNADGARLCGFHLQRSNETDGDMVHCDSSIRANGVAVDYNVLLNPGNEGIQFRRCTDCRASYNVIVDSGEDGICVSNDARFVTVEKNEIWRARSREAGLQVEESRDVEVRDNAVMNSLLIGIAIRDCGVAREPRDIQVLGNRVQGGAEAGISVVGGNAVTVANNLVQNIGVTARPPSPPSSSPVTVAAVRILCNTTGSVTLTNNRVEGQGALVPALVLGTDQDPLSVGAQVLVASSCFAATAAGPSSPLVVAAQPMGSIGSLSLSGNWFGPDGGQPSANQVVGPVSVAPVTAGATCPFPVNAVALQGTVTTPPPTPSQQQMQAPSPGGTAVGPDGTGEPGTAEPPPSSSSSAAVAVVVVLLLLLLLLVAGLVFCYKTDRLPSSVVKVVPGNKSRNRRRNVAGNPASNTSEGPTSVSGHSMHTVGSSRRQSRYHSRRNSAMVARGSGPGGGNNGSSSGRRRSVYQQMPHHQVSTYAGGVAPPPGVTSKYSDVSELNRGPGYPANTYGMVPGSQQPAASENTQQGLARQYGNTPAFVTNPPERRPVAAAAAAAEPAGLARQYGQTPTSAVEPAGMARQYGQTPGPAVGGPVAPPPASAADPAPASLQYGRPALYKPPAATAAPTPASPAPAPAPVDPAGQRPPPKKPILISTPSQYGALAQAPQMYGGLKPKVNGRESLRAYGTLPEKTSTIRQPAAAINDPVFRSLVLKLLLFLTVVGAVPLVYGIVLARRKIDAAQPQQLQQNGVYDDDNNISAFGIVAIVAFGLCLIGCAVFLILWSRQGRATRFFKSRRS